MDPTKGNDVSKRVRVGNECGRRSRDYVEVLLSSKVANRGYIAGVRRIHCCAGSLSAFGGRLSEFRRFSRITAAAAIHQAAPP